MVITLFHFQYCTQITVGIYSRGTFFFSLSFSSLRFPSSSNSPHNFLFTLFAFYYSFIFHPKSRAYFPAYDRGFGKNRSNFRPSLSSISIVNRQNFSPGSNLANRYIIIIWNSRSQTDFLSTIARANFCVAAIRRQKRTPTTRPNYR